MSFQEMLYFRKQRNYWGKILMTKEISIHIGNEKIYAFLKPGFFDLLSNAGTTHKHLYSEIQIIVSGRVKIQLLHQHIELSEGDMLVIPPNQTHYIQHLQENTQRIAFQITKSLQELHVSHPGKAIVDLLADEIRTFKRKPKSQRLSYCLALVICQLPGFTSSQPKPLLDRGLIITEFFSDNYNKNVSLKDLADLLQVSEKQAARLIKKYTGNCFRTELTRHRLEAARYLINDTDLNLEKIAEQVGYQSYSGFWKAFYKLDSAKRNQSSDTAKFSE